MFVSGFTIVRNGVLFDYPFLESIQSLLSLVDEFVINVGKGEDSTLDQIRALAKQEKKIKFFESTWPLNDEKKLQGGHILSEQTNLALQRCRGNWCFYLQADELLHEQDHTVISKALAHYDQDPSIEGLVFQYHHFYGSFDVVQKTRRVYRREIRVIKKASGAQSVGDAQGFRKKNHAKIACALIPAFIYHYGWVRSPEKMFEKTYFMDQLYHGSYSAGQTQPHTGDNYRYKKIWGLKQFQKTHPKWMQTRILNKNWHWDLEHSPFECSLRDLKTIFLDKIESWTGKRFFEYRNYQLKEVFGL